MTNLGKIFNAAGDPESTTVSQNIDSFHIFIIVEKINTHKREMFKKKKPIIRLDISASLLMSDDVMTESFWSKLTEWTRFLKHLAGIGKWA